MNTNLKQRQEENEEELEKECINCGVQYVGSVIGEMSPRKRRRDLCVLCTKAKDAARKKSTRAKMDAEGKAKDAARMMITRANMDAEGKAKDAAQKMITWANMDAVGKAKHAARKMITWANMDAEGKALQERRAPEQTWMQRARQKMQHER